MNSVLVITCLTILHCASYLFASRELYFDPKGYSDTSRYNEVFDSYRTHYRQRRSSAKSHKLESLLYMELLPVCPTIDPQIYRGYTPLGNLTAGHYTKVDAAHNLADCVTRCCEDITCNVMFMYKDTCYKIACNNDRACRPVKREEQKFADARMVLVQSTSGESWKDSRSASSSRPDEEPHLRTAPTFHPKVCEDGIVIDCPLNEECHKVNKKSRNGICQCVTGYERDEDGICVKSESLTTLTSVTTEIPSKVNVTLPPVTPSKVTPSEGPRTEKLVVSATSKTIQLPDNKVSLSAFVVEQPGHEYTFEWSLLSHPPTENTGLMSDSNTATLKLSHLVEGLYTFKVTVKSGEASGETFANVTVLPPKRINTPPVAVISPPNQTIQLPNSAVVLDASASHDDDKIVSYKWELKEGPIGYRPEFKDTATVQLTDLVAGKYTFRLTVEDSDGETSSTTAHVEVQKEIDYPPTANPGEDVIIYLPNNKVTLYGNLSTDDKGIASWEWTRVSTDDKKAVDMQDTRTPLLHLSNLEEGMYTFELKVTDTSGQSASNTVHVFVKSQSNKPPTARAGEDITMSLPITYVVLSGSRSEDDVRITKWLWKQISGPRMSEISDPTKSVVNVTGLTKGTYVFQLTVWDDANNWGSDNVTVTVGQDQNQPPKANAGGDQTVQLPVSVVILNGSRSSDDLGITQWEWSRDPSSLAAGDVVGDTDKTAVLYLVGLLPGRYQFRLKVSDLQGASSEDVVSVIVKEDEHRLDLVEVMLNVNVKDLTKLQLETLKKKIALLLHEEGDLQINVRNLDYNHHTGHTILYIYVLQYLPDGKAHVVQGTQAVQQMKDKLLSDENLLDFQVLNLETVVCQNNCSGHGECNQETRKCVCDAYWMTNFIKIAMFNGESNCDWSILYVMVGLFTSVVTIIILIWLCVCMCRRWTSKKKKKKHRYTIIEEAEEMDLIPKSKAQTTSLMESASDSDSEVLYDTRERKKKGGVSNGSNWKNGVIRPSKKVKT